MCYCAKQHSDDPIPLKPISVGFFQSIAFRLKWSAAPHEHVFHQVASNTWACCVKGCGAWYGEQAWI